MRMRSLILCVLAALLLAALPAEGLAEQPEKRSVTGFYLDTIVTLTAYTDDEQVLRDALAECGRYEHLLSATLEGSDVWRVNHAGGQPVEVSDDTVKILETALRVSELTDGAFDVTIYPASSLWDFTSGSTEIPDAAALEAAAAKVDYTKVRLEGNTVTLPAGMGIELGAIAKGYIADAVKDYLHGRGVENAILSFGGNVVCIGLKPDGSPWRVGIQDIDGLAGAYMLVSLNYGGSTVTSGIYMRGFDLDGVRYHHLLDAKTGWPVQNELAAVTIFSDSSLTGDALSTAAFVLGTEKGTELIESLDGVEALFVTREREISMTSGAGHYIA